MGTEIFVLNMGEDYHCDSHEDEEILEAANEYLDGNHFTKMPPGFTWGNGRCDFYYFGRSACNEIDELARIVSPNGGEETAKNTTGIIEYTGQEVLKEYIDDLEENSYFRIGGDLGEKDLYEGDVLVFIECHL